MARQKRERKIASPLAAYLFRCAAAGCGEEIIFALKSARIYRYEACFFAGANGWHGAVDGWYCPAHAAAGGKGGDDGAQ